MARGRRNRHSKSRRDDYTRIKTIEFFVFIGILLVATAILGVWAVESSNTAPPHAGVDVTETSNGYTVIRINTMGQAEEVRVIVNGKIKARLQQSGATYTVEHTKDNSKVVQIISDNGEQVLLLREFRV